MNNPISLMDENGKWVVMINFTTRFAIFGGGSNTVSFAADGEGNIGIFDSFTVGATFGINITGGVSIGGVFDPETSLYDLDESKNFNIGAAVQFGLKGGALDLSFDAESETPTDFFTSFSSSFSGGKVGAGYGIALDMLHLEVGGTKLLTSAKLKDFDFTAFLVDFVGVYSDIKKSFADTDGEVSKEKMENLKSSLQKVFDKYTGKKED